jgi:hypothetical protein
MANSNTNHRKRILYWLALVTMFAAFVLTVAQPAVA